MLIEKITRKIEIDENDGCHIHIRETTHLVDDVSGDVVHKAVSNHRKVIVPDDDLSAKKEGLTDIANIVWTEEIRKAQQEKEIVRL